ncbi:DUF1015 family protein [Nitriliruptor alkaliphilus]|uniref:DUF1015 family protein n=1 Tax=Nitriliruptor alkaliphilus TaxID=427918 RepID=UPI0006963586|nr:DUF1015 family protein [Nitriliruptor alkaliphilus]
MIELHPFTGHLVVAERAHRVVAPPYDALDPAARSALAAADPDSYLGALPPGTSMDGDQLEATLTRCRDHLDRLFATGGFRALPGPTLGVLALSSGDEHAVAVVGDVPVSAFGALLDAGPDTPPRPFGEDDDRIRPHEHVRDDRVAQLTRYLEVVGVASSPVALTQRPSTAVTTATDAVTGAPPDLAYRADDEVDVALWCVTDAATQRRLTAAIAAAGPAYLADGHHRGAAAARFASTVGAGPGDPAGRVLCAILPSDQLTVHPFHRRFDAVLPRETEATDAAVEALLGRLRSRGVGVSASGPNQPPHPHRIAMTADDRWWDLDVSALVRDDDLVEALDVRLVDRDLAPLLAGDAPQAPSVTVPAPLGLGALVAPGAIGVALHAPDIETVLAVAAAGRSLPAKTTYVTPKLRSGLVITPRSPSDARDDLPC